MQVRVEENKENIGKCGCGRSPIGHCIGWHALGEDEFRQALAEWDAKMMDPKKNIVE
jgi:hypothetical protein